LPENSLPLTLTLEVRADPQSSVSLITAALPVPAGARPHYYRFDFASLAGSRGQYYYAALEASSSGVALPLASGEAYLDGAAYRSHRPLDAQTSFRLVYAPVPAALSFFRQVLRWLALLAAAVALFVVPGWAMLAWLLPAGRLRWVEILGLAVGLSLAVYPVIVLWTHLVGLNMGPLYAWLPGLVGLAALGWLYALRSRRTPPGPDARTGWGRYRHWEPRQGSQKITQWAHSEALWPDIALLAVLGLVIGTRLVVVGGLETPMWGDGYQHTVITQLLVDHGGLFRSWAPYADLTSFTYHFGFHSDVAALHWLTGLPVAQATLWTGQILNVLAVLALYPLAVRVTGSRWAGVWAVLLAGLLSPMPMSYVNWGRYTQLAGLAILPAATWLTWEVVESPQRRWGMISLATLSAGGLALTHYRILLFYGAFVVSLMLLTLRRHTWRETLLRIGCAGLGAGVLFLPWFVNTLAGDIPRILGYQITTLPAQASSFEVEYNRTGDLSFYLAPVWWLACMLGLGKGLWQRGRGVLLVAVWWLLLLVATNPAWFSLPGSGTISNFALFISVFFPAGLLSGVLFNHLVKPITKRRWGSALIALALASLGLWGARERMGDLHVGDGTLVTRPDVRSAAWIAGNTPPSARFLVNSFSAYGDSVVVGSDGGWWLPLLAGRQNTVPPLNYGNEQASDPEYRSRVNNLARQVRELGPDDPAVLAMLAQQGITHVYIGQRRGRVNYWGPVVLDPDELSRSPHYRAVYHQDRVWVFALECGVCEASQ